MKVVAWSVGSQRGLRYCGIFHIVELRSSQDRDKKPRDFAGVQVLDRAMRLLEHLADAGGSMRLAELEAVAGLPLPTIHRLLRSLASNGYVQQEPSKRYALGPRLMRLGETANMAILEGDSIVYMAQAPSPTPCACSPRWVAVFPLTAPESARRCFPS